MATISETQQLYVAYFGRPADPAGLDYWVSTGITTKNFAAAMYAQPEFAQVNAGLSVSQQVNALYLNLFGRNGDTEGLSYWTQQINTGKLTLASIANDLIFAANNSQAAQSKLDKIVLDNKTATAIAYTTDVRAASASLLAYNPTSTTPWVTGPRFTSAVNYLATVTSTASTAAATTAAVATMTAITATGQTFTLTTAIDTFTGTSANDLFQSADAWTPGDTVNGGTGINTMNIVQTAAITGAPAAASVSGIQIVNLTSAAGVTLNTVTSTAGFSGLTTLTNNSVGTTALTTGATVALTSTINTAAATTISHSGGSTLTATLNGATTGGTFGVGSSTTAGAINATVNEINTTTVTGGTLTVTGGTTQTVTKTATAGISSVGAAVSATQGVVTSVGTASTTAVTVAQSAPVTAVAGVAAVTEINTITLATPMVATNFVTIGGLTYTALGATTVAQAAAIFANLSEGANANTPSIVTAVAAATGGGTVTGTLTGFTTGAGTTTTVVATSTQAGRPVSDIVATVGGAAGLTATVVETAAGVSAVTAVNGIVGGAVGITDVNSTSATAAGTINTITLSGFGAATANSSALATINLSGKGATFDATQGALTTATVTTQALNVTGYTGSGAVTLGSSITTLNLGSNTTASTIASLVAAGVTTLNVTGNAKVTLTAHTLAALTSVNSSTSTGGVAMVGTVLGNATTFTGGTGDDAIQVGLTTKALTLGAGNNTAILTGAVLGTGGTLTAGAGTQDILAITSANAATATSTLALSTAFSTAVSGFERLSLTTAASNTINVATLLGSTNGSHVTMVGGNTTTVLDNLVTSGTGATLIINGANTATTLGGTSGAGSNDVLNLTLNTALTTGVVAAMGTVTANFVETVNLIINDARTSTVPAQALNTFTLADSGLQILNISGNQSLALTHAGTSITSLNASGMTLGGLTYTAGALQFASTVIGSLLGGDTLNFASSLAAVTITETAGTNFITGSGTIASTLTGGSGSDQILGGSGIDTIGGGGGTDFITGGTNTDTMTGGAGTDTFIWTASAGAANFTTIGNFDTITDFLVGTDKLKFNGVADVVSGQQAAVQTAVTALAAGSTSAQIVTAMSAANTTDLGVSFATFGGDTYVLYETAGATATFVVANDIFIKLTGVTTIPTFAADVVA